MMLFRDTTIEELKAAYSGQMQEKAPNLARWPEKVRADLDMIRVCYKGGEEAIKLLFPKDAEDPAAWKRRLEWYQNRPFCKRIVKEITSLVLGKFPELHFNVVGQDEDTDDSKAIATWFDDTLKLNGAVNLYRRRLIPWALRDQWSNLKVRSEAKAKRVRLAVLKREEVVWLNDPLDAETFLGCVELHMADDKIVGGHLWTPKFHGAIDLNWEPASWTDAEGIDHKGWEPTPGEQVPIILYGDYYGDPLLTDAVISQRVAINLRSTTYTGLRFSAFPLIGTKGLKTRDTTSKVDGKPGLRKGPGAFWELENEHGDIIVRNLDFKIADTAKAEADWARETFLEAGLNDPAADPGGVEQPMAMAMREKRPMDTRTEWIDTFQPQIEQTLEVMIAYGIEYQREQIPASVSGPLSVDIRVEFPESTLPVNQERIRELDSADVGAGKKMPLVDYLEKHIFPGMPREKIEAIARELEAAEANSRRDLFGGLGGGLTGKPASTPAGGPASTALDDLFPPAEVGPAAKE